MSKKSLMFGFITKTWNPLVMVCDHKCKYCYAAALLLRLMMMNGKYKCLRFDPTVIRLCEKDLQAALDFKKTDYVFACSMCDLFADRVPQEYIDSILRAISVSDAKFLLLTKNPKRMVEMVDDIPKNCTLGVTLETNREVTRWSKAVHPMERAKIFRDLAYRDRERFVCAEPIMAFDMYPFAAMIHQCRPQLVAVGYDNHNHRLPEPYLDKTYELIDLLKLNGIEVYNKTLREKWNAK